MPVELKRYKILVNFLIAHVEVLMGCIFLKIPALLVQPKNLKL
jgi:hypothetical protein